MQRSCYSTILFDFDGTLIRSLHLWVTAFKYVFSTCNKHANNEDIIRHCFYRPHEEIISKFNIPFSSIEYKKLLHQGLVGAFEQAQLFNGAMGVLKLCQSRDINLGIVTSSPRILVDKTLKDTGICNYFQAVVTADDITNYKPHPESIILALLQLKEEPANCLIIGDSTADILAGHAAGIKTALFFPEEHVDFYDFEHLASTQPHYIFKDYQEIAAHLG